MSADPAFEPLSRLVGEWATSATHPALPGTVVAGTQAVEWLEGERFLIVRARSDHPDFPDSISIIGFTDRDRVEEAPDDEAPSSHRSLTMEYFDSRGVFRIYHAEVDERAWRLRRAAPGFSQRFEGVFEDGGDTIMGHWQLRRDETWEDDLRITFRRLSG